MLYDPKWDTETKTADLFTLTALTAWLETKDSDGTYSYINPRDCLLCQYLKEAGYRHPCVTPTVWKAVDLIEQPLPKNFNEVANGIEMRDTYGKALGRARAFLAAQR